jgi:hypothetical protein
LWQAVEMRRETARVSFLMCPFCVRCLSPTEATTGVRDSLRLARGDSPISGCRRNARGEGLLEQVCIDGSGGADGDDLRVRRALPPFLAE